MRRIVHSTPSPGIAVASVALLIAGGGIALASIPGGGVVHACYQKRTGALRVIDTARRGFAVKCRSTERALTWSQHGPQGVRGTAGPPGTPGTPGTPGSPGAPGTALGWAHVLGDGTVDSGQNVTSANVTHPFTPGYCFMGLGFVPHVAVVSLDGVNFTAGSTDAAQVKIGSNFPANNCPTGVQAIVHEQIASGTPEPFSIIFQ